VIDIDFNGFQRDTYARAIHEYLRASNSPRTLEEIMANTAPTAKAQSLTDPRSRALAHLNFWKRKRAYIKAAKRWLINPEGVHFEPREYAN